MQFDFGNLESPLPGTELINNNLEPWRNALHSGHMGPTRPHYAVQGLHWIDNSSTPWILKVFTGSDDTSLGTIDPATNIYTPAGVSQDAESVTYDNSGSGLSADNVQGAIDEAYGDYGAFANRASGFATAAQGAKADAALPGTKATKAELIAGTAVNKFPDVATLKNHPGICSAWVNFNGIGTVTIRDSYNVSSITDKGVGNYAVNFANPLANANYAHDATASDTSSGGYTGGTYAALPTVNGFSIYVYSNQSVLVDASIISAFAFGGK